MIDIHITNKETALKWEHTDYLEVLEVLTIGIINVCERINFPVELFSEFVAQYYKYRKAVDVAVGESEGKKNE